MATEGLSSHSPIKCYISRFSIERSTALKLLALAVACVISGIVFAGLYLGGMSIEYQIGVPSAIFACTLLLGLYLASRCQKPQVRIARPAARDQTPVEDLSVTFAPPQDSSSIGPAHSLSLDSLSPIKEKAPAPQIPDTSYIIRVSGQGKPYYKGRVGFPNPSNKNCSYNSMAIVYAHTGLIDEVLQRPIEMRDCSKEERFIEENGGKLAALRLRLQNIDAEIAAAAALMKPIQDEIENQLYIKLLAGHQLVDEVWNANKAELDQKLAPLKAQSEELQALKRTLPATIRELEEPFERHQAQLSRAQNEYREACANRKRAFEVLDILRGKTKGTLTEADAWTFTHVHPDINSVRKGFDYDDPQLSEKLRAQLEDPNWRAIQAGGHGHYWAYVRNPDGRTVNEINDDRFNRYPRTLTIDQIHAKWKEREAWRGAQGSQIDFY